MNKLTIGRHPQNDIPVGNEFPKVSNHHASIEFVEGKLIFADHSTNGTLINGSILHNQEIPIHPSDEIILGGEYRLLWPVILNYFPELRQATTPRRKPIASPTFAPPLSSRSEANPTADNPFAPPLSPPSEANPTADNPFAPPLSPRSEANPTADNPSAPPLSPRSEAKPAADNPFAPPLSPRSEAKPRSESPQPEQISEQALELIPDSEPTPARNQTEIGGVTDAGRLNSLTQLDIDASLNRFSPAAALGTWVWGLLNGIYWPLAIIPLSLIPFLGQVLSIFLSTYLGLNGNSLSWQRSKAIPFPKWLQRQQTQLYIGIPVFIICLAAQIFAFYWIMNFIF